MPYAVGRVQDAGLIFLSFMADSVVTMLAERGVPSEDTLPTALALLCSSTALVGVVVMLVGHFELMSYIQQLPTAVIGGYLAFIGFFCAQAGLAARAGEEVVTLQDWVRLATPWNFVLMVPGITGGVGLRIWVTSPYATSYTLPQFVVLFLCAFFVRRGAVGLGC